MRFFLHLIAHFWVVIAVFLFFIAANMTHIANPQIVKGFPPLFIEFIRMNI